MLQERSTEKLCRPGPVSLSVFTYFRMDSRIMHLFFHVSRDGDVSVYLLNGASFLQAVLITVIERFASTKALPLFGVTVSSAFKTLILPHLFSAVHHSNKRKPVSAHRLSSSGNIICFAAQRMAKDIRAFARTANMGFVVHQISPYLWFDHDMGSLSCFDPMQTTMSHSSSALPVRPKKSRLIMDQDWSSLLFVVLLGEMRNCILWPLCFSPIFSGSYSLLVCIVQTWTAGTRWRCLRWNRYPSHGVCMAAKLWVREIASYNGQSVPASCDWALWNRYAGQLWKLLWWRLSGPVKIACQVWGIKYPVFNGLFLGEGTVSHHFAPNQTSGTCVDFMSSYWLQENLKRERLRFSQEWRKIMKWWIPSIWAYLNIFYGSAHKHSITYSAQNTCLLWTLNWWGNQNLRTTVISVQLPMSRSQNNGRVFSL